MEGWSLSRIEKDLREVKGPMEARPGKEDYTDNTGMLIGVAESLMAYPEFIA